MRAMTPALVREEDAVRACATVLTKVENLTFEQKHIVVYGLTDCSVFSAHTIEWKHDFYRSGGEVSCSQHSSRPLGVTSKKIDKVFCFEQSNLPG